MGSFLVDGLLLQCSPMSSSSASSSDRHVQVSRRLLLAKAESPSLTCWRRSPLRGRPPAARPRPLVTFGSASQTDNSAPSNGDAYKVGTFMTKKENLRTVKASTTIDEALETLVKHRITGLPVVDDDWVLADRSWKTFNEVQRLLSKTIGRVVGDVMTTTPIVVHESTNLEDAARLLLETRYRRLPVVDDSGKLIGIITRGNVVGAALQIKREIERRSRPQS